MWLCRIFCSSTKIHDIGILASTDPVAIDRAGLDLIKSNIDTGTNDLLNQINRLKGENTVIVAEKIGIGSQDYNLINVDGDSGKTDKNNNSDDDSISDDEEEEEENFDPGNQKMRGFNIEISNILIIFMMILIL